MLIVLDAKTGEFISETGRDDVTKVAQTKDKSKMMELVNQWKTTPRVPISEAKLGGQQSLLQSVISFFAKNPMMIFALFYSYKWLMRNVFNKVTAGSDDGGVIEDDVGEDVAAAAAGGGADDTEF